MNAKIKSLFLSSCLMALAGHATGGVLPLQYTFQDLQTFWRLQIEPNGLVLDATIYEQMVNPDLVQPREIPSDPEDEIFEEFGRLPTGDDSLISEQKENNEVKRFSFPILANSNGTGFAMRRAALLDSFLSRYKYFSGSYPSDGDRLLMESQIQAVRVEQSLISLLRLGQAKDLGTKCMQIGKLKGYMTFLNDRIKSVGDIQVPPTWNELKQSYRNLSGIYTPAVLERLASISCNSRVVLTQEELKEILRNKTASRLKQSDLLGGYFQTQSKLFQPITTNFTHQLNLLRTEISIPSTRLLNTRTKMENLKSNYELIDADDFCLNTCLANVDAIAPSTIMDRLKNKDFDKLKSAIQNQTTLGPNKLAEVSYDGVVGNPTPNAPASTVVPAFTPPATKLKAILQSYERLTTDAGIPVTIRNQLSSCRDLVSNYDREIAAASSATATVAQVVFVNQFHNCLTQAVTIHSQNRAQQSTNTVADQIIGRHISALSQAVIQMKRD